MMLNKIAEWRVSVLEKAMKENQKVEFKLTAIYSHTDKAYLLFASIDGKGDIFVSSQRQERRLFKSLDTIRKATRDVGIPWFEVVG